MASFLNLLPLTGTVDKRLEGKARVLGSAVAQWRLGFSSLAHIQLWERARVRVLIHLK